MLISLAIVCISSVLIGFSILKCAIQSENLEYPDMSKVANLIRIGASACIKTQYFAVLLFIIAAYIPAYIYDSHLANGMIIGAILSLLCVFFSLYVSMKWNLLTAIACLKNLESGFNKAFESGRIISTFLFGLCLLSTGIILYSTVNMQKIALGMCLGSCIISAFSRISGGIFTKAADIVADLVGKVFNDMPEDDPRNPAVIADNIGDNVGDGSGTMCEIYSSYLAALTCAIFLNSEILKVALVALFCSSTASLISIGLTEMKTSENNRLSKILRRIVISMGLFVVLGKPIIGIIYRHASIELIYSDKIFDIIRNIFFVMSVLFALTETKTSQNEKNAGILSTMVKMIRDSIILSVVFGILYVDKIYYTVFIDTSFFIPFILGIITIPVGMIITIYYSSRNFTPVISMANACNNGGAAMNIICGYSYSLESAFVSVISFASILLLLSITCGSSGIIVALFAALGLIPSIMSMDAYGPICDNAGSIATMSQSDEIARDNTDELDSIGNMVKALTKSYICMISVMTTFILIKNCVGIAEKFCQPALSDPISLIGLLVGIAIPFLFSGIIIRSVSDAANYIFSTVSETINNGNPEEQEYYSKPITMLARKSLISSIFPTITMFLPIIIGCLLSLVDKKLLVPYLLFSLVGNAFSSIALSISMTIGGGALDNAKKLVESIFPKGHEARKAAVIGDTFGDPLKDTAGPSLIASLRILLIFSLIFFSWLGR